MPLLYFGYVVSFHRGFFEDKTLGSVTLIVNLLLMLQIKVVENELYVMIFVTLHFLFKPKNYD